MIETLARLGYASKALIYAIVGSLSVAAALNRGGRITDSRGALRILLAQPLGNTLLWLVAIGLCGYALWRVLDALFDPDRHGLTFSGLVVRVGSLVRALAYGAIGLEAFRLARGLRASSGGQTSRQTRLWIARIMDLPFGDWLVALTGLIVVGYGIWEIVKAVRQKTDKSVDPTELPAAVRAPIVNIARFGVVARAAVIIVLGHIPGTRGATARSVQGARPARIVCRTGRPLRQPLCAGRHGSGIHRLRRRSGGPRLVPPHPVADLGKGDSHLFAELSESAKK